MNVMKKMTDMIWKSKQRNANVCLWLWSICCSVNLAKLPILIIIVVNGFDGHRRKCFWWSSLRLIIEHKLDQERNFAIWLWSMIVLSLSVGNLMPAVSVGAVHLLTSTFQWWYLKTHQFENAVALQRGLSVMTL